MTRRFALFACLAVGVLITLPGCNNETKTEPKSTNTAMGAMNDRCPLTGMAVKKDAPTANYQGKTIAFCCGGCTAKFDAMTDAKKDEYIAKMSSSTAK